MRETLFAAAAELSSEPRKAFLDRKCARDVALRRLLDGLLQAHERVDHRLDKPAIVCEELEPTWAAAKQEIGMMIAGRYKLLEEIGNGGMGTVWMAEQKEPVKRLVAVKLIKAGMDSKAVLARFEAERQAHALMEHPNIAKVYDAGMLLIVAALAGSFPSVGLTQKTSSRKKRMPTVSIQSIHWFSGACELHRDSRNDMQGLDNLPSNNFLNCRKLMTNFNMLQLAKKA